MTHRNPASNGVALGRKAATPMGESEAQDLAETLRRQVSAERELSEQLRQHAGEWVAVRNHEIVAHARTLEELMGKVRGTEGEEEVEVFEVSTDVEAVYLL
jgi:hypothetical protein